ncbi:DNA mismatch repair protein MutS [Rhodophyticola sp. CCM32]|uniref:Smr/MutS family protein n=1 Tax=Rhodophyticola sp. CCM32 TaxID=2916397 RepID=UPI00107FD364|nr:Smr/MutS family protein [Rhodophyticola sp. CCM32]QBY02070.1 DNA mismatch repair protein MutS [Rhodophyticola sp. CCM32]
MTGRKGKGLSADDRSVWSRVAQTVKPLRPPKTKPVPDGDAEAEPPKKQAPRAAVKDFQIGERVNGHSPSPQLSPALTERLTQAPIRMDHGTHRQMIRGKLKPEARIDLHGLTLAEAHPRLVQFIQTAFANRKRLVLIITGKGKDREEPGPIPIRRGVLRHQVPAWLAAPPLGALVLDIRPAHLRHGGEGAYYVYLKRAR